MHIDRGLDKEDVVCVCVCVYVSVCVYNGILPSHRKNGIRPSAATWMDLEIVTLSEISQTEKDKYHMISLTCGI